LKTLKIAAFYIKSESNQQLNDFQTQEVQFDNCENKIRRKAQVNVKSDDFVSFQISNTCFLMNFNWRKRWNILKMVLVFNA